MQAKTMKVMDKGEAEKLERIIEDNYGARIGLKEFFLLESFEDKIWLASKEISSFDTSRLTVNSIGLNFGKIKRNGKINLTIEGAQIVGKVANKNLVLLGPEEARRFMQGSDVKPEEKINCEPHNFCIVKSGEDVLGSGLMTEEGIKNLLPKSRRILFD